MKKLFAKIINVLKFAWKYLTYQYVKRELEKKEKELIRIMNPELLTARDKDRLRANKKKISDGQPSHFNGMVRGFRKLRLGAQQSGRELYLGKKNKYGVREVLNGQKDAGNRCEVIIKEHNVHRLRVSHIIESLKKPA